MARTGRRRRRGRATSRSLEGARGAYDAGSAGTAGPELSTRPSIALPRGCYDERREVARHVCSFRRDGGRVCVARRLHQGGGEHRWWRRRRPTQRRGRRGCGRRRRNGRPSPGGRWRGRNRWQRRRRRELVPSPRDRLLSWRRSRLLHRQHRARGRRLRGDRRRAGRACDGRVRQLQLVLRGPRLVGPSDGVWRLRGNPRGRHQQLRRYRATGLSLQPRWPVVARARAGRRH